MTRQPSPPVASFLEAAEWSAIADALGLSPRELEVVRHLFDDRKENVIAARLGISPHTIHTHLKRVYGKLGVGSRAGVIARLFEEYASMVSSGNLVASGQPWGIRRRAA